jgi:hypothetical protein
MKTIDVNLEVLFDAHPVRGQRRKVKRIDNRKLRLPRGVRYWFTARTIGGDLDVVLANGKILRDLKDRVGITHADVGLIALDEDTPYVRLVVALMHEILHSCFSVPGERNLMARVLGCRADVACEREEEIVTLLAPILADCMLRSGLLRLPPLPRRVAARDLPKKPRHRRR